MQMLIEKGKIKIFVKLFVEAKMVMLNIILKRKNLANIYFLHTV